MVLDSVVAIQAAVDAVENDANEPNVVVAVEVDRGMLNAVKVVQQMVDPHFDSHQLKNFNKD